MAVGAKPTFEQACNRFGKFLTDTRWPQKLVWVRPDDVLVPERRFLFIKSPTPIGNLAHYRNQFEIGMDRELGVLIHALCKSKSTTYCFVWTPVDEDESARHMMPIMGDYLKMSIPTRLSVLLAKEIRSRCCWRYLQSRYKSKQELKEQLFC